MILSQIALLPLGSMDSLSICQPTALARVE